ncbi:MAG: hypothetical protein R3F11_19950 [Verrucomicrobiales bacterium]
MSNSKKTLNIAMLGTGFMGRAHSNAWRKVIGTNLPAEPHPKSSAVRTRRRHAC